MSKLSQPSEQLSRVLKIYREAHGLTLRAFGDALGAHGYKLDSSAVMRIERGTRRVGLDEAVAICRLVGIPFDVLLDPRPISSASIDPRVSVKFEDPS